MHEGLFRKCGSWSGCVGGNVLVAGLADMRQSADVPMCGARGCDVVQWQPWYGDPRIYMYIHVSADP